MQKKYAYQQTQKTYVRRQSRKAVEFYLSFGDVKRASEYTRGHHRARLIDRHRDWVAQAIRTGMPVQFSVVEKYPELIILKLAHENKN